MSLIGIRDMSLLEEAPVDRVPIQTYVLEYNEEMVREAVGRELSRDGQVYYVYNRVASIAEFTEKLREILPEARIEFAHGQMKETELEHVLYDFINGDIDVLVSTTIIETGIDIPNVNTMIVHDSDNMGLAQLYQLRGRVGRGNRNAYAFLMYKRDKVLKEVAEKRLEAIREFTDLGSGFKISMRDLEIRGAGNLLGEMQSGHMEAVGYDTYVKLLSEAIAEQKGEELPQSEEECLVDLPITAHISDSYIPSISQRIAMYRRIADIRTEADAEDVLDELTDRFGKPPATVMGLIDISLMRSVATKAHIYEITQNGLQAILKLRDLDFSVIPKLQKGLKRVIQLNANKDKPFLSVKLMKGDKLTDIVGKALAIISENEEQKHA